MEQGYFKYQSEYSDNIKDVLEGIERVYARIEDSKSKEIYINCLLYSMTNNVKYLRNNILKNSVGEEFLRTVTGWSEAYIYGAGERGIRLLEIFPEIDCCFKGYIDKAKSGEVNGKPIYKLDKVSLASSDRVLVSNLAGYEEIEKELMKRGVSKEHILVLEKLNNEASKEQYFEERCCALKTISGVFVDAGAYDGTDTLHFKQRFHEHGKIYMFEPDEVQANVCANKFRHDDTIEIIQCGLSDKTEKMDFSAIENGLARFEEKGKKRVQLRSLDDVLAGEDVQFIKMDIEGYEEKALRGARNIITEQAPQLAISIYHKREDIWRIPQLLLSYCPSYRFRLGHYKLGQVDTVLYAFSE